MRKEDLKRIGQGFYLDDSNALYLDMKEILEAFNLPDRPEVREALLDEIKKNFYLSKIFELHDEPC